MLTDRLCNEGAHNYAVLYSNKWAKRFLDHVPADRTSVRVHMR